MIKILNSVASGLLSTKQLASGILMLMLVPFAIACSGSRQTRAPQLETRNFQMVQVPNMISGTQERMEYVAPRYWNSLPDTSAHYLNDSLHIAGIEVAEIEQAVANFTVILERLPLDQIDRSVGAFYDRIASIERRNPADSTFERMAKIYERYLYDPNSPVRNEEFYLPFCSRMAHSELLDEAQRDVYAHDAQMCSLNRLGAPAADFSFSDRWGKVRKLYGIKASYTLLFFSNPGCPACKDIISNLCAMPQAAQMIADGRLAVLNIYIDEDLAGWYEYMPIYPETWYNGYDPNLVIRSDELYNVRAIPSLYLLDADKKVIMKDAPENKVLDYIYNLTLAQK